MDLASLYLRGFLGAKPFVSREMDSLADRMSVVQCLSADHEDRYFLTGAKGVTAATLGNKVVFGRKYYEKLSPQERLAAGAHEFAHVLDNDNKKLKTTASNLAISSALTLATLVAFHDLLLTESVFCLSFLASMWVTTSRDAERSRIQELRCDGIAASFVSGEDLLSSIRLAESMLMRKARSPASARLEERISALTAVGIQG